MLGSMAAEEATQVRVARNGASDIEKKKQYNSIFRSFVKRNKLLSRVVGSARCVSTSTLPSHSKGQPVEISNSSTSQANPVAADKCNRKMSRDLVCRRSFEVRKTPAGTFTPQCTRANVMQPPPAQLRSRAQSSNVYLEIQPFEDDYCLDGDCDDDDVFDITLTRACSKPLSRSHTHPKHRTKSVSSGCISSESGYGTMTRNGPRLRTPDNDEEVFVNTSTQTADGTSSARAEGIFVEALWDHVTMDPDELGFKVGDVIRVNDMSNADWWWGEIDSAEGWFPATFVRILVNQQIRTDSNNSDVIISNYASSSQSEDEISVTSHEFSRVTSFNDFCQCTEQRSTTSVHCNVCGRPLTDATPASRTSIAHPSKQPEIVITKPPPSNTSRKSSITRDQIRTNVIREIINSEKVFVGHLKDVVQGYLTRCRNRSDMFSDEILNTLFGNIEDIYLFQREFAAELEASLDNVSTHATNIGNVFLKHKDGFCIYSEYCNNHPQAVAELAQLLTNKKFMHFFEACRLLQRMIDIPLDGFLLTPVQKICKYPLQLAELLKYTHPGHQDYEAVKSALEAMKGVARMINERKRKMENLRKISQWQASIVNWQGESVLSRSCELVHSGEIHALSQVKGKPKPRVAFLFDHQMILCKKDLLRRDLLYYKARIDLDAVEVAPIDPESPRSSHSGSDFHSSSSLGSCQGWKVTDTTTGESGLMYSKNQEDCGKWMKAFALERKIVRTEGTTSPLLNEALTLGLLRNSLPMSRKPKESGSQRLAPSYRNRMKMAQELQDYSNKQNSFASDKPSFFSSVAGKLTPFRRTNPRESSFVF
uniref:PEM-2 n=1 Tax=Ciona savignyi TaxID=51511 RepID=O96035_CIOSA|nr:PEM-2 [Ciona savignyi]